MVVGGDFNTSLIPTRHDRFNDVDIFKDVLRTFGLTSLRAHDPSPNFIGPRGPVIDYVLKRLMDLCFFNLFP